MTSSIIAIGEDLQAATPLYSIFSPASASGFDDQWRSCFFKIQRFFSDRRDLKPFILRVFIAAGNADEFARRAAVVKRSRFAVTVPMSVLAQSPEKPWLVMVEAAFIHGAQVQYGKAEEVNYCKIRRDDSTEYWFAGVEGQAKGNIYDSADAAFKKLDYAFRALGIGFSHIVRQWNYIEKIFEYSPIDGQSRQNYQLFNEARKRHYSPYQWSSGYPAATGIGVDYNGVTIECVAVASGKGADALPVSNPQQVNAWQYAQSALYGAPARGEKKNQEPLFERGKLIVDGRSYRMFISGTASIRGQETIGLDDVEMQTLVTIENIESLTSAENLLAHTRLSLCPDRYAYLRVYVRRESDIPVVKRICRDHFGDAPIFIAKADICRQNLLVEIEGERIFQKGGSDH